MALGNLKAYYRTKKRKGKPDEKIRVPYVFTDPRGRFVVLAEREGKKRRRLCGSISQALELAQNINDLFPKPKPRPTAETMTLSQLCAKYRADDEARNSDSRNHAKQESNLVRLIGDMPLSEIDHDTVNRYLIDRRSELVGPKTANDDIKRLHKLLNNAVKSKILKYNPISKWDKLKTPPGRTRQLWREEEDRLWAECDEDFWKLVQIALLSGMRQSEQVSCTVDQILWEMNCIHLPKTKNNDERYIPMGKDLRAIVRHQVDLGTEWLCPNRSLTNAWSARNMYRYFEKARERAGIKDLVWHDLRRTYVSRLSMAGAPIRSIQNMAGHKSIKTTQIYAHSSQSHLAEMAKLLDKN